MISPVATHPHTGGAKMRIFALASALRDLGHEVWFLHVGLYGDGDKAAMRHWWGDHYLPFTYRHPQSWFIRKLIAAKSYLRKPHDYGIDDWYDNQLDGFLEQLKRNITFDAVIVEYVILSKALECFGNDMLKILDTHDVMTNRHDLFVTRNRRPLWFSTTAKEESRGLARADVILAIQEREQQFFSSLTSRPVLTLGHITPVERLDTAPHHSKRLLFIGSKNDTNVDAIRFLVTNILPLIQAQVPEVELQIVGNVCSELPDAPDYRKLGCIDDLVEAYRAADVVVNPVRFGTGLKIKNVEALGYGRPLVTTSIGAEGLEEGAGMAFLVAENPQEFAHHVVALLSDSSQAARLSMNAIEFIKGKNAANIGQLINILASGSGP